MTFEQGLMVAVGVLAGAVATLWGWFRNQYTKIEKKADDCLEDREELWKQILSMGGTRSSGEPN